MGPWPWDVLRSSNSLRGHVDDDGDGDDGDDDDDDAHDDDADDDGCSKYDFLLVF